MRIAFVGKGGAGKTTLAALFSHAMKKTRYPVLAIDADINMHLASLLGFGNPPPERHLSHPEAVKEIKTKLKGGNTRIKSLAHFRKTTPPTRESGWITAGDASDEVLGKFAVGSPEFRLLVVGTYDSDDVGASCYHNNLAILENMLSHMLDEEAVVIADMVAGVDAFANTLHAQFDSIVLSVEPTRRGVEVFEQYYRLSESAGTSESLKVVGNKVRTDSDREFLRTAIPPDVLLGYFPDSEYLRMKDQQGGDLDVDLLEKENIAVLDLIADQLFHVRPDYIARTRKLTELHKKYVAQDFIKERFGDLTDQIDESFDVRELLAGGKRSPARAE